MTPADSQALNDVLAWHRLSSHAPGRFAPGPGGLDWITQPDPFQHWVGTQRLTLPLRPVRPDDTHPEPSTDARTRLGQLLQDSLGLSAWKEFGQSRWALRMNPSSGNLHPTEATLICPAIPGLSDTPFVAHYAPRDHSLELRARVPLALWEELVRQLPRESFLLGLSSIAWREAWKYGERAFRYVHLDLGHALGALAFAAAPLGLSARSCPALSHAQLETLLGLDSTRGPFHEIPDILVVLAQADSLPDGASGLSLTVPEGWNELHWQGEPESLGALPRVWPGLRRMSELCRSSAPMTGPDEAPLPPLCDRWPRPGPSLRALIHGRRSAVAMDGETAMPLEDFQRILQRCLPGAGHLPCASLPQRPRVSLLIFVHRVTGLEAGLYLLLRDPAHEERLRAVSDPGLLWAPCGESLAELPLRLLQPGDWRSRAAALSCGQEIAGEGCISLGMLAEFRAGLEQVGPALYPRLYWECGLLGQVLYLEAEAAGLSGTGIGCFFDEAVHTSIGLKDDSFRSLYHFTIGGAVRDTRLRTLPPYADRGTDSGDDA